MREFKEHALKRLGALKLERNSFDAHWKSIARMVGVRSSRFLTTDRNKGELVNLDILDNTAPFALGVLASGLMAGLTSPARPWFRLSVSNPAIAENATIKQWLYTVENSMRNVFNSSNLYQTLPIIYKQLGAYGTAAHVLLDDDKDVIRCHALPIGSYYIACDGTGRVNTLVREYNLTVSQLVEEFGQENVSEQVKRDYDNRRYDEWVEVVHVIQPNSQRDAGKLDSKNLPFISCRFEKATGDRDDTVLSVSGFHEFPAQAPRWEVTGEDIYGSSCPGMVALGDTLMLQRAVKLYEKIVNKIADPPLVADAMLRSQRISMVPGALIYISGLATAAGAGVRPMQEINPATLAPLAEKIAELREQVNRAYYADMMKMFATSDISNMTAREVEERHQEKLLILGPVMERMNEELLDPIIKRTYAIMERKRLLPPAPRDLGNQPINIEYVSVMASAQKMIGTSAIERLMGFGGNLAAVKPEVLDKLNFDGAIDEMATMLGTSPRVVVPDDEVRKIRDARAQAAQAQAQAEQMAALAPAARQGADAARLLSETDMGGSSALQELLGV